MSATTSTSSDRLKKLAYELLLAHDVKDLFPGFTLESVVEVSRRRLKLIALPGQLKVDKMDGGKRVGVSSFTFSTLGHLVTKIVYKLQEGWNEENQIVVQDNLAFKMLQPPPASSPVIIYGTFANAASKIDLLVFRIEPKPLKTFYYASGSSNIAVFSRLTDNNQASSSSSSRAVDGERSGAEGPRTSAAGPPLPAAPSTSSAPPTTSSSSPRAVTLWRRPPTAAGAAPRRPDRVASTLRRPSADDAPPPKKPRHVAGNGKEERRESYMVLNVRTTYPKTDKTVKKMCDELGVEPENMTSEVLPLAIAGSRVYYFDVKTTLGCTKMDDAIEPKLWHSHFHVKNLVAIDSKPFITKAMPVDFIIETMLHAQRRSRQHELDPTLNMADDLAELLDKKENLGAVLKDADMTREALAGLNKRGLYIFKHNVKPLAVMWP